LSTIVTDAVTALSGNLALLPEGSGVVTIDGLTYPAADGSANQLMKTNGSGVLGFTDAPSGGFTQGTEQATTSGTSVTFGSIPSGVSMVVMNLFGVSQASNAQTIRIQLGDGGGIETSGYLSTSAKIADQAIESATLRHTAGFGLGTINWDSGNILHGSIIFTLQDAAAYTWMYHAMVNESDDDGIYFGSGSKALSAELTQIKFGTAAGATLDAGAINIMYM
jgi:hypothetical protein|tara:strand:+ start:474 stop:1139 length:666 start_codon:yes stop_codon:yes gene_type:complete